MNGTFAVTSIGDWARTDDVYRDEVPTHQTWQVTSQCDNPQSCTGHVVSDAGWSADLKFHTDRWLIHNLIPDWEKCPDGTAFPGRSGVPVLPHRPRQWPGAGRLDDVHRRGHHHRTRR